MLLLEKDPFDIEVVLVGSNRPGRKLSGSSSMDACHTRTWPVPTLLAQLNRTVLILMDCVGVRNVARQMPILIRLLLLCSLALFRLLEDEFPIGQKRQCAYHISSWERCKLNTIA